MQGDTTEENRQQQDPFEVGPEAADQRCVFSTVPKNGKSNVARCIEDNHDCKVDLERIDVIVIQVAVVPSDDKIIECRQYPGRTNGVVRPNVSHNGYFRRERHA